MALIGGSIECGLGKVPDSEASRAPTSRRLAAAVAQLSCGEMLCFGGRASTKRVAVPDTRSGPRGWSEPDNALRTGVLIATFQIALRPARLRRRSSMSGASLPATARTGRRRTRSRSSSPAGRAAPDESKWSVRSGRARFRLG